MKWKNRPPVAKKAQEGLTMGPRCCPVLSKKKMLTASTSEEKSGGGEERFGGGVEGCRNTSGNGERGGFVGQRVRAGTAKLCAFSSRKKKENRAKHERSRAKPKGVRLVIIGRIKSIRGKIGGKKNKLLLKPATSKCNGAITGTGREGMKK